MADSETIEVSTDDEVVTIDPVTEETEGEGETEEVELVLSGQDEEPKHKPSTKDYILNRMSKRKEKLQSENTELRKQLDAQSQSHNPAVTAAPDEYAFEDRAEYLQAHAEWQQALLNNSVKAQIQQQQNQHRIAAQDQQREKSLNTYAEKALQLKVSDFNETQDKAFDVLGDEFAQLIVQQLPEEASNLIYWFGKNPDQAVDYREKYLANPGTTTFALGKLAGKLTIQPKQRKAAVPEGKIVSGGGVSSNVDFQKRYDKIMDTADNHNISKTLNAIRALKSEATKSGFDVSTLK